MNKVTEEMDKPVASVNIELDSNGMIKVNAFGEVPDILDMAMVVIRDVIRDEEDENIKIALKSTMINVIGQIEV